MTDDESAWWNDAYREETTPWETERPQPALVDFEATDGLSGRILDVGCGIGTEALYFADQGYDVTGVDFAEAAIERARERREARDIAGNVRFRVADALGLSEADFGLFGTVVDCGMFHTLASENRVAYAGSLSSVLSPGGHAVLLEFGRGAPPDWPPNRISAADFRAAFADGWDIERVESTSFETQQGAVDGILAIVRRL